MSTFDNPFDPDRRLRAGGCSCGQHVSEAEHEHAALALRCEPAPSEDKRYESVVASAGFTPTSVVTCRFSSNWVMRSGALDRDLVAERVDDDEERPLVVEYDARDLETQAERALRGDLDDRRARPQMAAPLGFYSRHGLNVEVVKTAGWAVIRDKTINKEYDAAHMLAPMPIAISLGLGANAIPFTVPAIENINGQGITLAMKHKDKRDPKDWKGMKFAIPFDYSMHNYLLRYYLAEHGLDPDTDVQLRSVPPPEMVANLRADNIDGFLAPDNICQRAIYDGVGFMHILSKEIWDGHPCCSFAASREFITSSPNSFAALTRAIVDATAYASKAENRKQIAEAIAPANYINAPVTVLEQVLTGTYADGLGGVKTDAKRVDFDPFPWQSFAVWMLTQMKRWGQIKGDVDYKSVAEQVYLATDTKKVMAEMGLTPPATSYKSFSVMGKTFDPEKPDDYLASFKIRKAS